VLVLHDELTSVYMPSFCLLVYFFRVSHIATAAIPCQPPTATHRQVLIGSNTVSNVPLTLLMAPSIAALPSAAEVRCAWLLLSFVATVAGNLTLVGRCVARVSVGGRVGCQGFAGWFWCSKQSENLSLFFLFL
jgi:hypothetical protein